MNDENQIRVSNHGKPSLSREFGDRFLRRSYERLFTDETRRARKKKKEKRKEKKAAAGSSERSISNAEADAREISYNVIAVCVI